jgi:hypothetical protein
MIEIKAGEELGWKLIRRIRQGSVCVGEKEAEDNDGEQPVQICMRDLSMAPLTCRDRVHAP